MNKIQINDIQRALNWIRQQAEEADSAAKMEVLSLLNGTSQSVIAMAKKLTEPKTKTKVVTKFKDKFVKEPRPITKQGEAPKTVTDEPQTPFQSIQPSAPIAPLSNQQPPQ